MTSIADIVNRGLQRIGTRTTVTDAELANNSTNEAIQVNLVLENSRDDLLRMAPWGCGLKTANLVYITSTPGTPENTSPATTLWQPGQPAPPFAYEYQYPVDCLRACWIIPASQTGFPGIPITTAVTGGVSSYNGPPVRFKVQTDTFVPVISAAINTAGSGYVVGEVITLVSGPTTSPPIGAPVQLRVVSVNFLGGITGLSVITQLNGSPTPLGGSYFAVQTGSIAQGSTTGVGIGATFSLTFGPAAPQRVILTNQEFALLSYVAQVTDPNIMDTLFQSAWSSVVGGLVCMALTGDKKLANDLINVANRDIQEAREVDGNEGLTINDVTPDWIRARGINFDNSYSGPYSFDWGGFYPTFG